VRKGSTARILPVIARGANGKERRYVLSKIRHGRNESGMKKAGRLSSPGFDGGQLAIAPCIASFVGARQEAEI
jgi:hypothetical protein